MTDGGGQCVIMGLLSFQSWQRGGEEEKQRAYLMGEQQLHKNALKMRNGQNEAEMKLREVCLIEDFVVVSGINSGASGRAGVFGLDRDKAEKPSAREASVDDVDWCLNG